jgi:hypothetical protein
MTGVAGVHRGRGTPGVLVPVSGRMGITGCFGGGKPGPTGGTDFPRMWIGQTGPFPLPASIALSVTSDGSGSVNVVVTGSAPMMVTDASDPPPDCVPPGTCTGPQSSSSSTVPGAKPVSVTANGTPTLTVAGQVMVPGGVKTAGLGHPSVGTAHPDVGIPGGTRGTFVIAGRCGGGGGVGSALATPAVIEAKASPTTPARAAPARRVVKDADALVVPSDAVRIVAGLRS